MEALQESNTEAVAGNTAPEFIGGQKCRVLVVDDLRESAETLAHLLALKGFEAITAFDGHSALAAATQHDPDIILLDIGMPAMDGYEVARRLREAAGSQRLLLAALTGYGAEEDLQRASAAGFDAHFVKPVDIENLMVLLDDYRADAAPSRRDTSCGPLL